MLLTEQQLHEIRQIVADHHNAFIVNTISPEAVAPEILEKLKQKGLVKPTLSSIEEAYLYGQILAAAQNPNVANMSYEEFKQYLAKNGIPLSPIERQAVKMAQLQAGQYAKGLGNRVDAQTGQILIEADAQLRAKLRHEIQDKTAQNIASREGLKKLKSDLGWATRDWARDWDRIAVTEKHTALHQGMADHYHKRFGPEVRVFKRPMPDACPHCLRLHLGPDGQPRIFPLKVLEQNATNVGRKVAEWKPVIGATHPHCQCQLTRMPAGWGFNEEGDLVPGGALGVHYKDEQDLELSMLREEDLIKGLRDGFVEFQGLPIQIENQAGTYRAWKDRDGNQGQTLMRYGYGFIQGTKAADEEELDCYVGPDPNATHAYIIHQQRPANGVYDEDKVMLGFSTAADAKQAYLAHYNSPDFFQAMSELPMDAFKRWISGLQSPEAKLKKSERLVLLLKGESISAEVGAAHSPAGSRNPGPGTAPNYLFNVPQRPKPAKLEGITTPKALMDAEHDRKGLRRDPKTYELEPMKRPVFTIQMPEYLDREDRTETAEATQEWLASQARALGGIKNTPEKFVIRPDKQPVMDGSSLTKAGPGSGGPTGPHKYIERKWMKDHWVYKYAHAHGGKVEGHEHDLGKVALKLPKEKVAKLTAFKAEYELSHDIKVGAKYAILELTEAEADFLRTKTKGPSQAPSFPPPVEASQVQRLGTFEVVPAETLGHPPVAPGKLQRGHKVEVTLMVKGQPTTLQTAIAGFDCRGHAVFFHKGRRRIVPFQKLKPLEKPTYKPVAKGLPPGTVVKASERHQKLIKQALELEVVGHHRAKKFAQWLLQKGEESYLVGGVVRDMLAGMVPGSNKTDAQILDSMKDVDIVTTAHPGLHMQMMAELAHDQPEKNGKKNGLKNDASQWGVTLHGKDPDGLDLATMATSGTYRDAVYHEDLGTEEVPAAFDHEIDKDAERRDFTCNALYYDLHNDAIIDPTGHGIADAQNRVLRLAAKGENLENNHQLTLRFWKFRARGYAPEKETLEIIKKKAVKDFDRLYKLNAPHFFKAIANSAKSKGKTAKEALARYRAAMEADGMGDLYQKYIAPNEDAIIYQMEKKK